MSSLYLIALMVVHGLIHLLGFLKAFNLAALPELPLEINRTLGSLWLVACLLFIISALVLFLKKDWWWVACIVGVMLSQILIIFSWDAAKFGTVANVLIIIGALLIQQAKI